MYGPVVTKSLTIAKVWRPSSTAVIKSFILKSTPLVTPGGPADPAGFAVVAFLFERPKTTMRERAVKFLVKFLGRCCKMTVKHKHVHELK
jgi:hypothetical protein